MTHGPKQRIMVSTPGVPRAQCTLTSHSLGVLDFTTPEAVELPRSSETVEVRCRKKCFFEEARTFTPVMNGEDLASNVFLGGSGPLAIDLATNRSYGYKYDFVITLKPDPRCGSKRNGFLDGNPVALDDQLDDFTFDPVPKLLPNIGQEQYENKNSEAK